MTTENDISGAEETPARYIRLQVDLVMEITDPDELTQAAVAQIVERGVGLIERIARHLHLAVHLTVR